MLLMRHYGIILEDCSCPKKQELFEAMDQDPFEVIKSIAEKRDLNRIDTSPSILCSHLLDTPYQYYGKGKARIASAFSQLKALVAKLQRM